MFSCAIEKIHSYDFQRLQTALALSTREVSKVFERLTHTCIFHHLNKFLHRFNGFKSRNIVTDMFEIQLSMYSGNQVR